MDRGFTLETSTSGIAHAPGLFTRAKRPACGARLGRELGASCLAERAARNQRRAASLAVRRDASLYLGLKAKGLAANGTPGSAWAQPKYQRNSTTCKGLFGSGEVVEVRELKGIRVMKNEDDSPRVEYLVEWKDDSPDTW